MPIVRRFQVVIGLLVLIGLIASYLPAQEPERIPHPPAAGLVAVPSFQGELPDGTPVIALIVLPPENVLNKNAAWQAWEQQWPTRYRLGLTPATPEAPAPALDREE